MTDQARIRLAEMMGWTDCGYINDELRGKPPNYNPDLYAYGPPQLPNPLTDANDDYAVLEWMRTRSDSQFSKFMSYFAANKRMRSWQYQIGDYARAALAAEPPEEVDDG